MPEHATEAGAESGGVAAVDRALSILGAFRLDDGALTLAELAARTGIYKSTILRLSQSLIRARLLLRLDDGQYRIGPEALRLGTLYQRTHHMADVVLPVMRDLMEETGESVVLHVREGGARVVLHRVESRHAIRYHVSEGDTLPLSAGSGGRVLAAFSGSSGEPFEQIRERFHHASFGERVPDTSGMAAPIFGPRQALAGALTIAGPSVRIDAAFVTRHLPALLEAAALITNKLGGNAAAFMAALEAARAQAAASGRA
ncbi:IclR family transcriptional regulator [Aliidongia dinghuensis]|nr:IclR family transcriptional regulator [Aliidongia dinghuensis]